MCNPPICSDEQGENSCRITHDHDSCSFHYSYKNIFNSFLVSKVSSATNLDSFYQVSLIYTYSNSAHNWAQDRQTHQRPSTKAASILIILYTGTNAVFEGRGCRSRLTRDFHPFIFLLEDSGRFLNGSRYFHDYDYDTDSTYNDFCLASGD
jgi:hypothetical protein